MARWARPPAARRRRSLLAHGRPRAEGRLHTRRTAARPLCARAVAAALLLELVALRPLHAFDVDQERFARPVGRTAERGNAVVRMGAAHEPGEAIAGERRGSEGLEFLEGDPVRGAPAARPLGIQWRVELRAASPRVLPV